MAATFNKNWRPDATSAVSAQGDSGVSPYDYDYAKAFSGIDGLVSARLQPDGTYKVYRGGSGPYNDFEATATIGPDGRVTMGDWRERNLTTNAQALTQFGLGAAALGGGLAAIGQGPFAGLAGTAPAGASTTAGGAATGGAVGGTGLSAAPGAGLSLATPTASGAGLSAAGGSGLTLAGATGTGAGLATGTGAGVIGSGIGASIPAGAVLGGATGGAATSSLPSWLTSAAGKAGGNLAGQLLLGGAIGAAAGSGGAVSTANQQGVANTLGQLGLEQADIARDQYTEALDRIKANDPMFTQILQNALTQAQQQGRRSDQLWSSYTSNFLPAAEKFAQTAMNYDTPGRRAEEEARARAGVETEAAMQRQAQTRALNRAGISLDSGRALTLDNAQRLQTTKLSTGAADAARRNVEATGLNLLNTTAGIGQGIVGTSQQQAGQSLTAGNAAASTLGAKESARNATLAPTQAFYGGATSATGAAGNVLNGIAATEAQNNASKNAGLAGLGSLAGTLLTAGKDSIIGDWLSDPKSKTVHGKVSGKKAVKTLADAEVYDYTYKKGMGDGGRHVGRMAGPGDKMGPDGMRRISPQDEIGTHAAAIKQIAKDVKALKKTVATLADA